MAGILFQTDLISVGDYLDAAALVGVRVDTRIGVDAFVVPIESLARAFDADVLTSMRESWL